MKAKKIRPSKFTRHHGAYVLTVRHPDDANQYTVDGDVHIIDIDLGSSFTGSPDDEQQAKDWARNIGDWLDRVPITSPVYTDVVQIMRSALSEHPKALAIISQYTHKRES